MTLLVVFTLANDPFGGLQTKMGKKPVATDSKRMTLESNEQAKKTAGMSSILVK